MLIFSIINLMLPVLGAFFSYSTIIGMFGLLFLLKAFFGFNLLTLGLPTIAATLFIRAFNNPKTEKLRFNEFLSFVLAVILPLVSICLFILHPVGKQAFVYSFYWFIPVVLFVLSKFKVQPLSDRPERPVRHSLGDGGSHFCGGVEWVRSKSNGCERSLFSQYLIATFIAHAVGSIMWLYVGNLTSEQWLSLIPVVAYERLIFAGIMTCAFFICNCQNILSLFITGYWQMNPAKLCAKTGSV